MICYTESNARRVVWNKRPSKQAEVVYPYLIYLLEVVTLEVALVEMNSVCKNY